MAKLTLSAAIILSCTAVAVGIAAASADQNQMTNAGEYKIQVLDNCQVVRELPMTSEQIKAYKALQAQEQRMHELAEPVQVIEAQMHEYSKKLERITALAIQDNEDSLHINKAMMHQQQAVAAEFSAFVTKHQAKFDALSQQGEAISAVADAFETAIQTTVGDIKHQNIHIISPEQDASAYHCYHAVSRM